MVVIHVGELVATRQWTFAKFIAPLRIFLDAYMDMICDLALLLATLSIMTGALVITGVPTKLGALLIAGCRRQSRRHGADGLHLRRHLRHRPAAGADLHPGGDRDRAADDPGRRQSVGGALLRLLPRLLRRVDAADLAGRSGHGQDRQRQLLLGAQPRAADLRVAVHADGRRVRASRTGGAARHPSARRRAPGRYRHHRHLVRPAGAATRR